MLGEVAKDVIGNNETKITSFLEILEERVIFNRDHSFGTYFPCVRKFCVRTKGMIPYC